MFEKVFSKLHDAQKEIKMIGVWGKDGLELERKDFEEIEHLDVELVGAEIADLISKIDGIKISPQSFYLKFSLKGNQMLIYSLTENYFLILLTEKNIIPGRLKFYIDLYRDQFVGEL